MTQDTITETRTETTTHEITKHRCPLCETYHESDDLAVMTAGGHETELCRYCAASILAVDSDEIEVSGGDADVAVNTTTDSGPSRLVSHAITIATTAIVGLVGVLVASEVMGAAAGELGDVSQVGAPLPMPDLLPVVLPIMVVFVFFKAIEKMPRM